MAGTIAVYCREVSILGVLSAISQTTLAPDLARSLMNAAAESVAHEIKRLVYRGIYGRQEILSFPTEEDLLRHADRMTDFLILDLADHFRYYDWSPMPGYAGAAYMSSIRDS